MTTPHLCPVCQSREKHPKYRPFCSKACSLIDVKKWLDGAYRLPLETFEEIDA